MMTQPIKIYYDGTGENLSYLEQLIMLGVDVEQMKMPVGCPDWVIEPIDMGEGSIHGDVMIELKWSSQDFHSSYKSHHLHSQICYAIEHCQKRLVAVLKTPWTIHDGADIPLLERQFQGEVQAIFCDYNCPVEVFEPKGDETISQVQDRMIIWLVQYLKKATDRHRVFFGQDEWVEKNKKIDINVKHWALIDGIYMKRALMIKEKYANEHDLYNAIYEGPLGIPGIDKKLEAKIWDDFVQRGWIEE
jgi:hypothetical protein